MAKETIKISGYSEGDKSVGIGAINFEVDTGLKRLQPDERNWIIRTIIKGIWGLHDNGDLSYSFSDEEKEGEWCEQRKFGDDENRMLLREDVADSLDN